MKVINEFKNQCEFLSNFYPSNFEYKNKMWSTVEHAFQASKTLNENKREEIRIVLSPSVAKQLGREIKLRKDWDKVKKQIMYEILLCKFSQNKYLSDRLINTKGYKLIEGNNWHDNIWGNCFCRKCKGIKGKNFLGKLLMRIRRNILYKEIKNGQI